jgi:hypothetical protein
VRASRLRGLAAEADSVVSFGESLWSPDATGEVHEKVENSLRRGIAAYYRLGQLLAMPALLERPEITACVKSPAMVHSTQALPSGPSTVEVTVMGMPVRHRPQGACTTAPLLPS